jgi:hypothetical protein
MPERSERPKVEPVRRPGWASPMVRDVLKAAGRPMAPIEVKREVEQLVAEPVPLPTIFWTLTRSRWARRGIFVRVKPGFYKLRHSP